MASTDHHITPDQHRDQLREIRDTLRRILTKSTGIPLGIEVDVLEADGEDRIIFSYRGKSASLDVATFLRNDPMEVVAHAVVQIGADLDAGDTRRGSMN